MAESEPAAVTSDSTVTLTEVTADSLGQVLELEVAPEQRWFFASNAVSIAQAYFDKGA